MQVINARTISMPNKLRSVTQKVALQINAKLGGELWAVEIPLVRAITNGMNCHSASSVENFIQCNLSSVALALFPEAFFGYKNCNTE